MNSNIRPEHRRRLGRTLGLGLGLGLALLANLGDRAFSASAANGGIDPLEILDTGVKNNILFIVDTSGSMAGTPQDSNDIVGGDDPASRFYQTKRAVREVIATNAGKANFGLATFHPDFTEHLIDGTQNLVYVTQDPTGNLFRNNFNSASVPAPLTDQCATPATCTAAESTSIFRTLKSNASPMNTPYPDGCTPQTTNQVAVGGATNPPITHVPGTPATNAEFGLNPLINIGSHCRYYVKSRLMLNGRRYSVRRGNAETSAIAASSSAITCPPPPPGLLGDDVLAAADGSKPRACFQLQDVTSAIAMFQRATIFSSTNTTSYQGANWTPAAGSLLIAFVTSSAATPVDPATLSGHGVSYTKIALAANTISTTHVVSVWVATAPASPTSAAAVASFGSNRTGGVVIEYEVTGADLSGGAAAAILQKVTSNGTSTVASTTLGAAGNAANGVMYFITHLGTDLATPNGAWTEGSDGSYATPSTSVEVQYRPAFIAAASASGFASSAWRGVALEIKTLPPTNTITTYWVTGTNFDFVDVNAPIGNNCAQSGINVDVADCGVDNSEQINSYMRMELQYNGLNGAPRDVPALTTLANRKPNISEAPPFSLDVTPPVNPPFTNPGIRQGNGTPLSASMNFALTYFRNTVLPAAGTLKRPLAAQGKQRQFVILLTDGDESCSTQAAANASAYALWSNALPALPACDAACLAAKGITADQWSVANRIEMLFVTFAGGTPSNVNAISTAGTGFNPNLATPACTLLYPGSATNTSLAPCRPAFIANNLADLVNALNFAINTSTATGEFSDQQSVTETVFEFASVATPPTDPLDPEVRYSVSVPVLLQSTFELPEYKGHLNAFRRSDNGTTADLTDDTTVELWDAGLKLYNRVSDVITGMGVGTTHLFPALYGNANNALPTDLNKPLNSTAKIKRRIFTTSQNGFNPNYSASNLLNVTTNLAWTRIPLWPPTTSSTSLTSVAPTTTGTNAAPIKGQLDAAMGFDPVPALTIAQWQALVPGACQGNVPADIHPDCADAAKNLARARREAREITLAYLAGAQLQTVNGFPVRVPSGGNARELQYVVRPWIMVESTLAAPGVVTPPLLAGPKSGELGFNEYKHYRDGLKVAGGAPDETLGVKNNGLGLRNPDRGANAAQSLVAQPNLNLKPVMSVVYHATNQGLHAFRAGPCPNPLTGSGSGLGTPPPFCDTPVLETGGEELWAFVPFDQLAKLPALTKPQNRSNKQYLLASPVRFSDIWVPAPSPVNFTGSPFFDGVWRTVLYFGRGQGGKYYTALDVTTPGPFTRHSLATDPPIVVWSRGNPDTTNGLVGGTVNNTTADRDAYLKMGETWSLPAVGFVPSPAAGYGGANFALFTGSGYSDTASEGKTFYVLNALNGNVLKNFDIPDGTPAMPLPTPSPLPSPTPATVLTNFLVASPVVYAEDTAGNSPSGFRFIGNPISVPAKTVYFGDLHSRIWRYDVTSPSTAPTLFFEETTGSDGNQPFATAVSVLQNRPDIAVPGEVLVYAESGHDRRVLPQATKPFKAYAWKDVGGVRTDVFERNFETGYRGTVQPATAFAGATFPPAPVVFYAGIRFTVACVSTFDSILIALRGLSTVAGVPEPAFDLRATGDDAFIELTGKKINAIRVSGEGNLVVDQGLSAQNAPPPPGVPVPSETTSTSSSLVQLGLTPGSQAHRDLAPTTVPYRIGSSVCRVDN